MLIRAVLELWESWSETNLEDNHGYTLQESSKSQWT